MLDARPATVGLATDVSRYALRRAARAHPRAGAVLCDAWSGLPVADGCAAAVVNVFAPRNGAEFARVLRPDGVLLVATPGPAHLAELVSTLDLLRVDPAKEDRLAATLSGWFAPTWTTMLSRSLELDRAAVRTLVDMGPSAWHTDPDQLATRIAALPEPIGVTAEIRLSGYAAPARP
jgi:23S rRNA (guanine745-N1)-methyltransferase